jgi:protein-S-isoprenylcysteine O-methyltransferase Ste14
MFLLILTIAIWGIVHSVLASTAVKDRLRRLLGDGFMKSYRLLYNLFAVISILPILFLMITLPDQPLYQTPSPFSGLLRLGQGISALVLIVAVLQTDVLSFVGLRQLFAEERRGSLIVSGLYHWVRHPLYTFSLLALWLSPNMSLNSFIVYVGLTLYILIGIIFEERKLVREFGDAYVQYRAVTPMLLPGLKFHWNK